MRHQIIMLNGFCRIGKQHFVPCTVIDTTPSSTLVTIDDGSRDLWRCFLPQKDFRLFRLFKHNFIDYGKEHYHQKKQEW